jgi:SAM-dependent methyltransferase
VDFDDFSATLRRDLVAYAAELASAANLSEIHAESYLGSIINEASLALRLLTGTQLTGRRVLEVGAGAGLLTAFLQSRGIELVAIEPIGSGFGATATLRQIVRKSTGIDPNILPLEARQLNPTDHGLFDVIFSINVVEHFQPFKPNMAGLERVMSSRGLQIHTCPNYFVPYEPHFGIPLLPFAPHLTIRLWRRDLRDNPLWHSLNFVTAGAFRRFADRHGLEVAFESGAMARTLRRLQDEPAFSARQPAALVRVASIANRCGLTNLLEQVPPGLATPLTATLRRKSKHRGP